MVTIMDNVANVTNQLHTEAAAQYTEDPVTLLSRQLLELSSSQQAIQNQLNQISRRQVLATRAASHAAIVPSPTPDASTKSPKVPLPDKFDGNRRRFRDFKASITIYMTLRQHDFHTAREQTLFLGSLLNGTALSWFRSLLDAKDNILDNTEEFLKQLELTFGDPSVTISARRQLDNILQGPRPASVYASEFKRIANDTGFDENSLCYIFRRGLRQAIRKELVHHHPLPDKLDELMTLVIDIDNVMFELEQEERHVIRDRNSTQSSRRPINNFRGRDKPVWKSANSNRGRSEQSGSNFQRQSQLVDNRSEPGSGEPMDIDVLRTSNPGSSTSTLGSPISGSIPSQRTRLTREEREDRRRKGNCIYCNQHGHVIKDCPELASRRQGPTN
jgi:hypothetical protein